MTGAQAILGLGSFLIGFLIPELLAILANRQREIPFGMNFVLGAGVALCALAISDGAFA